MGKPFFSGSNENVSSLKDGRIMKTSKELLSLAPQIARAAE